MTESDYDNEMVDEFIDPRSGEMIDAKLVRCYERDRNCQLGTHAL